MDKERAEQHYEALQLINEQIKALENEVKVLERRSLEMLRLKHSLKDVCNAKGAKTFSSLGLGVYAESELRDTENFLVNVGAGVMLKKSSKETDELIDERLKEIEKINSELVQNIQMFSVKAATIQNELQKDLGLQ